MTDLSNKVKAELERLGADIVGFGRVDGLPEDVRAGLPIGISVAALYPKEVIRGIAELPTLEYREWYDKLNDKLDAIINGGVELLNSLGYKAVAQNRAYVSIDHAVNKTKLPHKTVATRAGIGWIGKSAVLVTERYGSAIRLSSILTDAPLNTNAPIDKSRCGSCMICKEACPAGAISGKLWEVGLERDEFYNHNKCSSTARARAKKGFNEDKTICGKCIEVCPYTRQYTCK